MAETTPPLPLTFKMEADRLVLVARLVSEIDLGFLLREVNRADTLGPIIDPTRYKGALDRGHMRAIANLAHLAVPLATEFKKVSDMFEGSPDGL